MVARMAGSVLTARRAPNEHRFTPYIPLTVRCWSTTDNVQRREGSLASVDLSGFTALTERLAERGREGTEEINRIVSTIFTALIDIVSGEGGDVLSFGGDAILVWFDAADGGDPHPIRAARCSAGLQLAIRRHGSVRASCGAVRLRMSVGVHCGSLVMALVGTDDERHLLTLGPVATETVALEAAAAAGQVLVSPVLAAGLPRRWLRIGADGRTALRLAAVTSTSTTTTSTSPAPAPTRRPAATSINLDTATNLTLGKFVPRTLRNEIGNLVGEHRLATVAFVKVAELDDQVQQDPTRAYAELDKFGRLVSQRCADAGVTWLGTDISADSVKFLIVGGAPVTNEDDEERVLRVCRALVDESPDQKLHVGVNSGPVYFADVGHPDRRVLTTMGDATNLAARLMGKAAPGQIVASAATLERTFSQWGTIALEPFTVKGKRSLQHAAIVGAPHDRRATTYDEIYGRDRERTLIATAVTAAGMGFGSCIDIAANAGTGKSALVSHALRAAPGGKTLVRGAGDPYLAAAPYRAIHRPLRELFGVSSPAALKSLVRRHVPRRSALMPLIADAFGWSHAENIESGRITPEFRQDRTIALVGELVRTALAPAVLWVDDVQWFDEASRAMVEMLSHDGVAAGLLLVCTRRPNGVALRLHEPTTIALRPLAAAASRALVNGLAARPLHPHIVDAIVARAGGHPFYLRALTASASSDAGIDLTSMDLPASVERAAASVLDRLPPDVRSIVRELAVGGRAVALDTFAAAAGDPTLVDRRRWRRCVEVVEIRDGVANFRHDLYRDAAYLGLSAARRRHLHGRFADVIADSATTDEARALAAPVLATHFAEARRFAEAWTAGVSAARAATASGAWSDAEPMWSLALHAAGQLGHRTTEVRDVLCESAVACERLGRLVDAEARLRRANRFGQTAMTTIDIARVMQRQGSTADALRVCRRAQQLPTTPAEATEASLRYASILNQRGRSRQASVIELALLERDDLTTLQRGRAALQAQLSLMAVGDPRESVFGDMAIDWLSRQDCGASLGDALNNQSLAHWYAGRLVEGARRATQAMAEYDSVGDAVGSAIAANNLAGIWLDQGRLAESEVLLVQCLGTFVAAHDRFTAACVRAALATVALRQGDFVGSRDFLEVAKAEYVEVGADDMILDADLRHCELLLWQRQPDEAFGLAVDCLERSKTWSAGGLNTRWARRLLVWANSQLGRPDLARNDAVELLDIARATQSSADIAMSLATLEALDKVQERETPPRLARERLAIVKRAGVRWVPELPVWPLPGSQHVSVPPPAVSLVQQSPAKGPSEGLS